jgi:tripartite ATP-independent transporter DctP family solute receptor
MHSTSKYWLFAVLGGALALSQAAQAANFKLAHQFAPDSLPGQSATHFVELVKTKSNGATTITVIPGGALGDEKSNLQQVANGSIDMALTGTVAISFMAQPYNLVSMDYLFDSADHILAVFNGEIGKEINAYIEKNHGVHALGWQYVGTRMLTANKPIRTVGDLKGLKVRLPGVQMSIQTWKRTGADVVSVAFTELYLALQTGTVDAEENPPNFIRAQKFYEVQRYLMDTNHRPQMNGFFINSKLFGGLDAATRKAISDAGSETVSWASQTASKQQDEDIAWLTTKGGMERIHIDLDGIQDLIKDVPRDVLGESGVELYKRIRSVKP